MRKRKPQSLECDDCRKEFNGSPDDARICSDCVRVREDAQIERDASALRDSIPVALRSLNPGDRVRCSACERTVTVSKTPADDSLNAHDLLFFAIACARAWHWQYSEACHDDMGIDRLKIVKKGKPLCRA